MMVVYEVYRATHLRKDMNPTDLVYHYLTPCSTAELAMDYVMKLCNTEQMVFSRVQNRWYSVHAHPSIECWLHFMIKKTAVDGWLEDVI